MTAPDDETCLLDAAEQLFYARGYQAVGMDEIRAASQLSLKRIYALHKGKDQLAVAMLARRDDVWLAALDTHVNKASAPIDRVLAVFDWLALWLSGDGYRGCAWINAFGELGGTSAEVTKAVQQHKARFADYLSQLATEADVADLAPAFYLLAEGAMVTAGIQGRPDAAYAARSAAMALMAREQAR